MQVRFTTTLVCALSCFACSGLGSDDGGENPDPGEGLSDANQHRILEGHSSNGALLATQALAEPEDKARYQ